MAISEYDVGYRTGFIEALDEMNRQIALKYCDLKCNFCEGACPFDTITEDIKNDKIKQ